MARVPFQKLGKWATTSFFRFVLVFGSFMGIPWLLYFSYAAYDSGGLSASYSLRLLVLVVLGSLLWCSLMWFTVVGPLKAKLRQPGK